MPEPDNDNAAKIVEKAVHPLQAMHSLPLTPPIRAWRDILPDEMGAEMLTRDGRFQIMVSFMRLFPVAAIIIDDIDRIIFINAAAERYFRVRLWDVRGKLLADIMKLDARAKQSMSNEHTRVLGSSGGGAQIFLEHFHNGGSERLSMLKFPFTEDDNYRLIGCFMLPSSGSADSKLHY